MTVLLNPSAFAPSERQPHIPKTERNEQLKIYGDAEVTVSTEMFAVAPETDGRRFVGIF